MGLETAAKALVSMLRNETVRGVPVPAVIQTAKHVQDLFPLTDFKVRLDTSGSALGKARARALHWAASEHADVWLSCDDDCTASPGTIQQMVRVVQAERKPRIVVAPFPLRAERDSGRVNLVFGPGEPIERGVLVPIKYGGFGLVAVNGYALKAIVDQRPNWLDDDGVRKPLVFNCEVLPGFSWLGEDYSFFEQVRPFCECYALIDGETTHDGHTLGLEQVGELYRAQGAL